MKKQIESFLREAGFTDVTGSLYKHPVLGIVNIPDESTELDIVNIIYLCGRKAVAEEIKTVLQIKS